MIEIRTNNVPRDVIEAYELSAEERAEFDYYNWDEVGEGLWSPSFFRYKGQLYDLGEFEVWDNVQSPQRRAAGNWDAYSADTFFSGLLVKYPRDTDGRRYGFDDNVDFEHVIVGSYYVSSDDDLQVSS